MRPPLLDGRLATAFKMVRSGATVADIGTDHGHLALHLALFAGCPKVYAVDIRPGPLEKARGLAVRHGVLGRVECVLANGLATLKNCKITDVVIAGMGGLNIIDILNAAPWLQTSGVRLVLCPTTGGPALRRYLCETGFDIEKEEAAVAGGRFYAVMQAAYTGCAHTPSPLFCALGKTHKNTPAAVGYIKKVLQVQKEELSGKAQAVEPEDIDGVKALVQAIEEVLARCQK